MCYTCVCTCAQVPEECRRGCQIPRKGLKGACLTWCWEPNSRLWKSSQYSFLSSEPSLQPRSVLLSLFWVMDCLGESDGDYRLVQTVSTITVKGPFTVQGCRVAMTVTQRTMQSADSFFCPLRFAQSCISLNTVLQAAGVHTFVCLDTHCVYTWYLHLTSLTQEISPYLYIFNCNHQFPQETHATKNKQI